MLKQLIDAGELGSVLFAMVLIVGLIVGGILVYRHHEHLYEIQKLKVTKLYAGDRQ